MQKLSTMLQLRLNIKHITSGIFYHHMLINQFQIGNTLFHKFKNDYSSFAQIIHNF